MSEKTGKKQPVPKKPGANIVTYGQGSDHMIRKGSSKAKHGTLEGKSNVIKGGK